MSSTLPIDPTATGSRLRILVLRAGHDAGWWVYHGPVRNDRGVAYQVTYQGIDRLLSRRSVLPWCTGIADATGRTLHLPPGTHL